MKINDPGQKNPIVLLDAAIAGPLFMLSAALLFTIFNLIIKVLNPSFTVWHIGFYRFFGGLVVLMTVFGRKGNPYQGNNIRLLIIRGLTGSVGFIFLITAIRMLPVSTAVVIFYSFPAFSAISSYFIYGERLGKGEIACIAVVVGGVGIIMDFQLAGGFLGPAAAILSSAFAGLTVTLIRSLREKNGPVIIYLYLCTIGAMATFPIFIFNPMLPSTPGEWVMISGIILSSVIGQLLMNQGFFYCKGWEGGVFMSSEVIFTTTVGIVFLDDPTNPRFWVGSTMLLGSIVTLNRLKANGKKN